MMSGGAEIYRTQFGNNNAYNLDTVANWLEWTTAPQQAALTTYTSRLMQFRRAHPSLRPADFFTGADHNGNGLKDLTWYRDNGAEVDLPYFLDANNHFLAYRLDESEFGGPANSVYVAYNGWTDPVVANLPAPLAGKSWYVVADTSASAQAWGNIYPGGGETLLPGQQYTVQGRSVALLIEK
jgi:glycogen operon protein